MRKLNLIILMTLMLAILGVAVHAQDVVELRMTWYSDGSEDIVMRDLLDRFEAENPGIKVTMDVVNYSTGILETLPIQLAASEGPDMARVTNLGGLSQYYLDLRPYLSDPDYWEANMGPFLDWMRPADSPEAIPGFMTQLTVTGPYINRTLFEQAEVEVPSDTSDEVTWEQWAEAARAVAEATGTPFPMAMDRSGHRFAGPAVSMGATYFNEEGRPDLLDDAGFRAMAELFIGWHQDGTMPPEVWAGSGGSYAAANEEYINGQLVFYMSGSWQIGQFAEKIGDAFDWQVVPNPCGPGGCTGMPGGAALVAIKDTKHPEEVAKVMEYLTQEDVIAEFYARTLFIPGHLGLAEKGIDFDTENAHAKAALETFAAQVPKLAPLSYALQGYPYNSVLFNAVRDRLTQVIVGELTLDEAIERMQADVDAKLAEVGQ